ncbi:MAG: leucyl aminopeptidase [Thermaerobacter sp.]|nr:leucyl aminopeptidase [Thermaerobacter sp.]
MELILSHQPALELATDMLTIGVYQGQPLSGSALTVDQALGGVVADLLRREEFRADPLEFVVIHSLGKIPARRVLLVGLGVYADFSSVLLRKIAGLAAQTADDNRARTMVFEVPGSPLDLPLAAQTVAEGLHLGLWQFDGYHQKDPSPMILQRVDLTGLADGRPAQDALTTGIAIAAGQNLARSLGAEPSNKLYPELLARAAVAAGETHSFPVEVFDERKLEELGMGALLGVGQGSAFLPRLVVMRYQGGGNRTLALVGKGITFDSGGISLKPGAGMEEMKYDMLGAAAVLGAMCAIADTRPAVNVVGIMAIAQNMPSGTAYKPGDVVTAFNGKTIEITNTDAEGRVVLADAVSYAASLGVDWIVEASTLTGAAIIVLGHEASALVSADDPLATLVLQASEAVGERVWRLPVYPEYKRLYRSAVADIKNAPGRDAGTITGGMIIAEFAGEVPFAHLDIAGTAWTKRGPLNRVGLDVPAPTGVMVRSFVKLAHMLAE